MSCISIVGLHGFTTLGNLGIARAFSPPLWSPTWKPWLKADQLALRRTHPKSARNAMIWADAGFASEWERTQHAKIVWWSAHDPACANMLCLATKAYPGVFMDQYPGLSRLSENRVPENPCFRSKLTFWEGQSSIFKQTHLEQKASSKSSERLHIDQANDHEI